MTDPAAIDTLRLIISAILGIGILLVLVIKFKMQAVIAILIGAICIGLFAGMPLSEIVSSVNQGIGETLKGIALLVGLGSMFGAILEVSGGAEKLSRGIVARFGQEKAAWALAVTGMVIAIPVFFDAGLIILIPLAFSLARETGKSTLYYAIPLLAGLAVGHAFIPPTPGPVLVAHLIGADLGLVILVGLVVGALPLILAGPLWGRKCASKFNVTVPAHVLESMDSSKEKRSMPGVGTILFVILLPLALILIKALCNVITVGDGLKAVVGFLGEPFIALLISTLLAMWLLGTRHGFSREELEKVMSRSLQPAGMILLVTAAGGVLRYILQNSGLGAVIGDSIVQLHLPLIVVAFVIAALVRIAVGSATVAMTMAAGIIASMPAVASLSPMYLACMVAAIAGGATVCSHFNDSGFWLVKSLLEVDERTTLKTWTIMETIVGVSGFVVAFVISLFV